MKKRTITLEDGAVVDCGVEEFEELKKAIKEENQKEIVKASVKVLLSSDTMMDKLVKDITEGMKKLIRERKEDI